MALLGALSFMSGAAQGRAQRQKDDAATAYQAKRDAAADARADAQDAERHEETEQSLAQSAQQYATTNARADAKDALATRLDGVGLVVPPEYYAPANAPLALQVHKQLALADFYTKHGALNAAKSARETANTLSSTGYLLGAKTAETEAQTGLIGANAAFTRGAKTNEANSRTWLNYQRPRMLNDQIAAANARASASLGERAAEAKERIASSTAIAQYNGQLRSDLASLALQAHLQGADERTAAQYAIAQYTQAMENERALARPGASPDSSLATAYGTGQLPTLAPPPVSSVPMMPQLPAIIINNGPGGYPQPKLVPPGGAGGGASSSSSSGPIADPVVSTRVQQARAAIKRGASPADVMRTLDATSMTAAQKAAIRAQIMPAPPPVSSGAGGSPSGLPFLLRQALGGR